MGGKPNGRGGGGVHTVGGGGGRIYEFRNLQKLPTLAKMMHGGGRHFDLCAEPGTVTD